MLAGITLLLSSFYIHVQRSFYKFAFAFDCIIEQLHQMSQASRPVKIGERLLKLRTRRFEAFRATGGMKKFSPHILNESAQTRCPFNTTECLLSIEPSHMSIKASQTICPLKLRVSRSCSLSMSMLVVSLRRWSALWDMDTRRSGI